MITGVALKSDNGDLFIMPEPYRHDDVIHQLNQYRPGYLFTHRAVQGFIDQDCKFYSRVEAAKHSIECGQIEKLNNPPELFSEDLW